MTIDSDDFPRLYHLLVSLYPGCERGATDPDAMPEAVARRWPDGAMGELRQEERRALDLLDGMDAEAGILWLGLHIAFPGGRAAQDWLRDLVQHIDDYHHAGRPFSPSSDGIHLPRVSTFHGKEETKRAVDAVNAAHSDTIRAWDRDERGPWRLHLYADLGQDVGHYLRQDEVMAYKESPDTRPRPPRHPATGCVVLWRKHPQTREAYVAVAYPEIALPTGARDRYPDLPLLFGGYFGQDYMDLDGDRFAAERNVNRSTPPAVRQRIATQLTDLLTQDDDALRRDVEALGSYVLPDALRRWVTGLHRRMTRIDWSRP